MHHSPFVRVASVLLLAACAGPPPLPAATAGPEPTPPVASQPTQPPPPAPAEPTPDAGEPETRPAPATPARCLNEDPAATAEGWECLADGRFGLSEGHVAGDRIALPVDMPERRFRELRLWPALTQHPLEVAGLVVTFDNGVTRELRVGQTLNTGEHGRPLVLCGDIAPIREVEIRLGRQGRVASGDNAARISVWGRDANVFHAQPCSVNGGALRHLRGAAGFRFGSNAAQARGACVLAGGEWTQVRVDRFTCSRPVADVGFEVRAVEVIFAEHPSRRRGAPAESVVESVRLLLPMWPAADAAAHFTEATRRLAADYGEPASGGPRPRRCGTGLLQLSEACVLGAAAGRTTVQGWTYAWSAERVEPRLSVEMAAAGGGSGYDAVIEYGAHAAP